jgi:chaperone LolA
MEIFLKSHIVLSAFFIFLFAGFCLPQDTDLLSRVRKNYDGNTSLSASFDLAIFWKVREKDEKKSGKIIIASGDRFHIELDKSAWVSDGKTLWQYDKGISQVVVKPVASFDPNQLPSHIITQNLVKYPFKVVENKGGTVVFAWQADSTSPVNRVAAQSVRFTVDAKAAIIKELVMVDKTGNESTYRFHGTAIGGSAPKNAFTFDIPKGARVVDSQE